MGTTYGQLVAANLRAARARADLPQHVVAKRMKRLGYTSYSSGKLSACERGERGIPSDHLLALAVSLGCTLRDLVGDAAPNQRIVFADPRFEVTGVTVRNSGYGWNDHSVSWDAESDYPAIVSPVNMTSAAATDKSDLLAQVPPHRFARRFT